LAWYLKPERCIQDNGGKFIGADFQQILVVNGVKVVPMTMKNPQSNTILKRIHHTAGNIIHTLTHAHPPANLQVANQVVDSALSTTTMHALQCSMHYALVGMLPGAFVYQRDIFLNISLIANLQMIQDR
jgi:hypothetical protein